MKKNENDETFATVTLYERNYKNLLDLLLYQLYLDLKRVMNKNNEQSEMKKVNY